MVLINFFLFRKRKTANIAKKRLQTIVSERRRSDSELYYLPQLKRELFDVIKKYVQFDPEIFSAHLEKKDKNIFILELNVTLLEQKKNIK